MNLDDVLSEPAGDEEALEALEVNVAARGNDAFLPYGLFLLCFCFAHLVLLSPSSHSRTQQEEGKEF